MDYTEKSLHNLMLVWIFPRGKRESTFMTLSRQDQGMEMMRQTGSVYKSYKHPFGYHPIVISMSHLFMFVGLLIYHVLAIVGA